MRKFCVVTKDFSGLGFALLNKSDSVFIARNPDLDKFKGKPEDYKAYQNIGKGMVDVKDLKDVMRVRHTLKDTYFVFDGNHSTNENETLRAEGFKVCLGGNLPWKMENDREFGIELAEKMGIESPLWEEFKDGASGIAFLKQHPNEMYFLKPNASDESHMTTPPVGKDARKANELLQMWLEEVDFKEGYILQEKVRGTEVNLEYFCVNGKPVSAQINLEVKRISEASLIDGYEKGTLCGCAYDVCKNIPLDNKLLKETIGLMLPFIEAKKFTGFADMNFIVGDNNHWFIEWCWRTGYNAHPNYFMNVSNKDYLNTLADMVDGKYKPDCKRGWGASITVYTDFSCKGVPIDYPKDVADKVFLFDGMQGKKGIVQTGVSNELAIVGGYGDTIQEALMSSYDNISKLRIIKGDYRSDGLHDSFNSSPIRRWRALGQLGYL